jgi:hypothetical protein
MLTRIDRFVVTCGSCGRASDPFEFLSKGPMEEPTVAQYPPRWGNGQKILGMVTQAYDLCPDCLRVAKKNDYANIVISEQTVLDELAAL